MILVSCVRRSADHGVVCRFVGGPEAGKGREEGPCQTMTSREVGRETGEGELGGGKGAGGVRAEGEGVGELWGTVREGEGRSKRKRKAAEWLRKDFSASGWFGGAERDP